MTKSEQSSYCSPIDFAQFLLRWTPRTIIAGFAGYYSLGMAYDRGLMAAIDRVAIQVFRHFLGYAGMGAIMPTFQWYSAWGVRIVAALAAGLLYDLTERMVLISWRSMKNCCCGIQETDENQTGKRTPPV